MILAMAGFDYTTSSLEEREQLALTKTEIKEMLTSISESSDVEGCVYVSTCGRGELYLFCEDSVDAADILSEKLVEWKNKSTFQKRSGSDEADHESIFQKQTGSDEVNHESTFQKQTGSDEADHESIFQKQTGSDEANHGSIFQKRTGRDVVNHESVFSKSAGCGETYHESVFRKRSGRDVVNHLFHLACGMRSQIYGEDQILAQLKQSLELAREAKAANGVLDRLFLSAIAAGKKVKTAVRLTAVPVSVADRMMALLKSQTEVQGKNCLVIGNGEIGRLCAAKLLEAGARVTVTVRNYRTREVLIPVGCGIVDYRERFRSIPATDVIVSATTSPHFTLAYPAEMAPQEGRRPDEKTSGEEESEHENPLLDGRKRWLFDLALPRDIAPEYGNVPGIHLFGLDEVSAGESDQQTDAAARAEEILKAEEDSFFRWLDFREANRQAEHVGELAAADVTGRIHKRVKKVLEDEASPGETEQQIEAIYADAVKKVVDNLMYDMRSRFPEEQYRAVIEAMEQSVLARSSDKCGQKIIEEIPARPVSDGSLHFFPLFLDTREKTVLIYGAGKIALRRVRKLLDFACRICVISPNAEDELLSLAESYPQRIHFEKQCFVAEDLIRRLDDPPCGRMHGRTEDRGEGGREKERQQGGAWERTRDVFFVVAATDHREVNREIGEVCRARGVPVSVADRKEESTCYFPGIAIGSMRKDGAKMVAGISSDGADHRQTAWAVRKVSGLLNEGGKYAGEGKEND